MNKDMARLLGLETEAALKAVAEKYGMTAEVKGGKYNAETGSYEPKVVFLESDTERKQFSALAWKYGFSPKDYGRKFVASGKEFTLIGFTKGGKPMARKTGDDGPAYLFPIASCAKIRAAFVVDAVEMDL